MTNNRFKRLISMLMCMVVIVSSPCTSVYAHYENYAEELFEDGEEFYDSFGEEETVNDELFSAYMLKEAEAVINETEEENVINEESAETYVERGSLLAGNEKVCYDEMKEAITRIAAGEISDTKIYIPIPEYLLKDYTAEMLGVDKVYENGSITNGAMEAMKSVLNVDMKMVVRSLMLDMPYELYWFDKVTGYSMARCVSYKHKNGNNIESLSFVASSSYPVPAWRFTLYVSKGYSKTDELKTTDFNTELAIKAADSAKKAAEDVLEISGSVSSDYAKLKAYNRLIQSYSGYNYEAESTKNYPYGDPWQMIYVFDEDPSTKVVCEGFSKAFKFMCELSSFAGDIECSLVSGFLNGPSGNHMWNNVRMEDGKTYLVDVTNSRSDSAANFLGGAEYQPDRYFTKTSNADGTYTTYAYSCGSSYYYYDKFTMNLYDNSDLVYSTLRYEPSNAKATCNITLSMNYADGGRQLVTVYNGEDSLNKILNITPIRDGYSFNGWYTAEDGGEALAGKTELIVSDNKAVFYAHWNMLPRYDVTAHSGMGAFSDGSTSTKASMYIGKKYYETFEIPVRNDHYEFNGWYENESCSADKLIKEKDVFGTERSRDIYAGWKIKRYKLTLNPCGGTFSDGSVKGKIITYNALSSLSDPSKYTPLMAGYEFMGWFTESDGGEEYDISQPIEKNVTLYAHWKEIQADPIPDPDPDPTEDNNDTVSQDKPSTPSENKPDSVSVNGFFATFSDASMYRDDKGLWHAVYSGVRQKPAVLVYDNRQLLCEGVDYTIRYANNLKAFEVSGKTAYAEIKGKGSMKGTYRLDFVIDRLDIEKVVIGNLAVKEGSEQKADPALIYNGRALKKDRDYSCEVKQGSAELKGIGNCCGSVTKSLIVQSTAEYAKKQIKVKLDAPVFTYDGSEKVLKAGSELIVTDKNGANAAYSVSYSDNVNAGSVTLTVCGTGSYHGVIKKSFRIKPCSVKGTDAFDIKYDRTAIYKPGGAKACVISVSCNTTAEMLKEGRDYKLSYKRYKKCGKAVIKVSFKGNYKGSSYPVISYRIEKRDLKDAKVYTGDMAFTKPGKYSPRVVVTCDGSLVAPKEYRVEYPDRSLNGPKENMYVSVMAREKNYSGSSESVSYNAQTTGIDINRAKVVFAKGARSQYYEGLGESVTLIPGKDFTLKVSKDLVIDNAAEIESEFEIIYTDNTTAGTAYMIVVPKTDKYIGITKAAFKIKAAEITDLIE